MNNNQIVENQSYWEQMNDTLRSDKIEFAPPVKYSDPMSLTLLKISSADDVKKAVQYALNNPKEIAELEYKHNNGQPIKITEMHLDRVRKVIESKFCFESNPVRDGMVYFGGEMPLDHFLLQCHGVDGTSGFDVITDDRRKTLTSTLFGSNRFHENSIPPQVFEKAMGFYRENKSCTQIIFDSADIASAIDQLVMSLSDRTQPSWRIRSVYVQESLRNQIYDTLTTEKLNATNNIQEPIAVSADDQQNNAKLAARYGGKLVVNDINTICLLFDVPVKYLADCERKSINQIPTVVNFFRTTKELIQLIRTDLSGNKLNLSSIWTENIGLFYEVAAEIDSNIIWSNCIGLFHPHMPISSFGVKGSFLDNRFVFDFFYKLFKLLTQIFLFCCFSARQ